MADLHLLSPRGFRAGAVYAGIKSRQTPDVGILLCDNPASAAAAFTTNKVIAAPVMVGRDHISTGKLRGIVVNAGNANACTGKQGIKDALRMCALAAKATGSRLNEFLPSSTGIIGHLLPMDRVERGIIEAAQYLGNSLEHALLFGSAILTTDTKRKAAAIEFKIGKDRVTLAGVCKGSGMIGPHLSTATGKRTTARHATMLAYLTTDANIASSLLRKALQDSCEDSFNCVTVDDHASTNDTAVILASGQSERVTAGKTLAAFTAALREVTQSLAYQIAADGEGATKVVTITVKNARSVEAARAMARAIANSPLVKTAMHGNDPNWGRIVSAAGFADVPFDPNHCTLILQGTAVFRAGQPLAFDADAVSKSLAANEVKVELDCRMGRTQATVWTCDLSREYITINADYHT